MIPVGGIVERPGLVDDSYTGFLGFDKDFFYVVEPVFDRLVQRHGCLDCCLGMKLRRVRDLEQYVFHHITAEALRKSERFAAEEHVEKAPGLCA